MMELGEGNMEVHYNIFIIFKHTFGYVWKCHRKKFNEIKCKLPQVAHYLHINNNQVNIVCYSLQNTFHT